MTAAAVLFVAKHAAIGAAIGATTAAATGGDPRKGAQVGAITGPIGAGISGTVGSVAPSAEAGRQAVGAAVGGGVGGAGSTLMRGKSPTLSASLAPAGTTTVSAGYASGAERQRRQRRKGYGSTILAGGELGLASTYRKQILGG